MAEITKINIKGVDYDLGGAGGGLKVLEKDLPESAIAEGHNVITEYFTSEEHNNLTNGFYDIIKINAENFEFIYLQKTITIIGVSTGYTGLINAVGVMLLQMISNANSISFSTTTIPTE